MKIRDFLEKYNLNSTYPESYLDFEILLLCRAGSHAYGTNIETSDEDKASYDKPPYSDDKVFNTHLHIFFNEILKYYGQYNLSYIFKPTDNVRYVLYRMAMNKYLDKNKYEMIEDKNKEILIINPI